jgi:hypothetical protein
MALGAALAFAPQAADAAQISTGSDVNVTGFVNILPNGLATNATGFDFLNPASAIGEGDLAVFTGLSNTTMQDIPEGTLAVGLAIDDFYVVSQGGNTLIFNLLGVTEINRTDVGGRPTVSVSGIGFFESNLYDDTQATFILTVQGDGTTTFSASSEAIPGGIPAPEPVSLAIFGVGLLGLGAAMRRRA